MSTETNMLSESKNTGLKLSGVGKVLFALLGLIFFIPLLLLAVGLMVLIMTLGGALMISLIVAFLGVALAIVAAIMGVLGGSLSFPVVWPWI